MISPAPSMRRRKIAEQTQKIYDEGFVVAGVATGAIGIETLLPLALEMHHNESLPLNKIIETLTINPAKILKITAKRGHKPFCVFSLLNFEPNQ